MCRKRKSFEEGGNGVEVGVKGAGRDKLSLKKAASRRAGLRLKGELIVSEGLAIQKYALDCRTTRLREGE
jgi:hypothetical protein